MKKNDTVIIHEAEGDINITATRTVYQLDDDCWYDTSGTRWPFNDQYRYTLVNEYAGDERPPHPLPGDTA